MGKGTERNKNPKIYIYRTTVHGNDQMLKAEQIQESCNKQIQKRKGAALHQSTTGDSPIFVIINDSANIAQVQLNTATTDK
jgi:hypothetical protein